MDANDGITLDAQDAVSLTAVNTITQTVTGKGTISIDNNGVITLQRTGGGKVTLSGTSVKFESQNGNSSVLASNAGLILKFSNNVVFDDQNRTKPLKIDASGKIEIGG